MRSLGRPYGVAILLVLVATAAEFFIRDSGVRQLSLTPLSLAIAASAVTGGLGPGLLALCLSALAMDALVLEPGLMFRFRDRSAGIQYIGFVGAWLVFCLLTSGTYRRMEADRARRAIAERRAFQADRIAQLTASLAQARTPAAAIEAALQEPLHALGADAGLVLLMSSDARAEVARVVGHSPEAAATLGALAVKTPASDAIGRGAPVFIVSPEIRASEYGTPGGAFGATIAIPLMIGSRVVALVQLDFASARAFTDDDREYLDTLATRAAQALDRTWQYEYAIRARAEAETQRARADQEIFERQTMELALRASEARGRALAARTSRLHGLTAALSEAVTLDAVGRAVVQQGRTAVGAVAAEVTLLLEKGTVFQTLYAQGEGLQTEPGQRSRVEAGLCATEAVSSGTPVFVASFEEWQARYPKAASLAADGGYVSSATVPLLVEGAPIGVLAFYFTAPVNFDHEYRELLVSVAQDCAQALDRARLYEAAQQARAEAEAANRLKDEFVSIVSHELRTPLNAILGWTAMLRRGDPEGTLTARALQSVHDNAARQARLIDELLDFSKVTSGHLALARDPVDLRHLLRGVVESLIPQAVEHGVTLELSPVPGTTVIGDQPRLEQVFFNLLGNALKFTPEGGRVSMTVLADEEVAEVRVADTGLGIEPEFLPFVFERFRQSDDTAGREFGGLGLGLSIARQLVEAHNGTIRVESEGRGKGAVFTVRLPAHSGEAPTRQRPAPSSPLPAPST
jgi:signal transduction histidine kinase